MIVMQMSQPKVQMKKVRTKGIVMKMMRLTVENTVNKTLSPWERMLEEIKIFKLKMT